MRTLIALALLTVVVMPAAAEGMPRRVGECAESAITGISDRFGAVTPEEGDELSGTRVTFANGGVQISYDRINSIWKSKIADQVTICLVSIPKNCPKGDDRGKMYFTKNRSAGLSWKLSDSQHTCGGA